jgi:hypothetical protein
MMRSHFLKIGFGLAMALTFTACEFAQLTKANDEATQPKTEATVIGIWRGNIPVTTTTPPSDIKVTMVVNKNYTLLLSKRVATGKAEPNDFIEISKENFTWTITDGKMVRSKVNCEYKDPVSGEVIMDKSCETPLVVESDINVKGSAWTVMENDEPMIYRKD